VLDLVSRLQLGSAAPFGLAIQLAGLLLVTGVATWVAFAAHHRRARVASGLFAALAAARLALGIVAEPILDLDLSPRVSASTLAGTWRDGRERLVLRGDGTFALEGATPAAGRWRLDGDELDLSGRPARVIGVRDGLRIVPSFPEDPDLWDGDLGFARDVP